MGGKAVGLQIIALVSIISVSIAKEECNEFTGNTPLQKLCKRVESQKTSFSRVFAKLIETEKVQNWFLANREILESIVATASSGEEQKRQLEKDREQDNKINAAAQAMESVKDQFHTMLKQQHSSTEAILDGKITTEANHLHEEIKSIRKRLEDLEVKLSTGFTLIDAKNQQSELNFINVTAKIDELNENLEARLANVSMPNAQVATVYDVVPRSSNTEKLEERLREVTNYLTKQMAINRAQIEAELYNLTSYVEERIQGVSGGVETRLNGYARLVHDSITNASIAFVEDLEVLRQLLTNTSNTVAYLTGRDLMAVRSFEDIKSSVRRQETIQKSMSKQLSDLQHTTQDQLHSARNGFQQQLMDFYQKVSDRQNQMTSRLTSLVDDVANIKSRVRNIQAGTQSASVSTAKTTALETADSSEGDLEF